MYKGQDVGQTTSYCDGTQLVTLTCLVPMSALTAAPFNYVFDDLVRVRATSTNFFGTGTFSGISSTGARIRQIPSKATTPFLVSRTKQTMTIRWSALVAPDTGNSGITTYNLFWDNGLGTVNIQLVDQLVTEYSLAGLTGGVSYSF